MPLRPDLRRTGAWTLAALFALGALAAAYQFAGCVTDEHPPLQIVLWALVAVAFAGLAWAGVRRACALGPTSPP